MRNPVHVLEHAHCIVRIVMTLCFGCCGFTGAASVAWANDPDVAHIATPPPSDVTVSSGVAETTTASLEPLSQPGTALLFGRPNEFTGLSAEQCTPHCVDCAPGGFTSPLFDTSHLALLRRWQLSTPFAELASDPYEEPAVSVPSESVCGFIVDPIESWVYSLQTFSSAADANEAGAIVTHGGVCGVCSSLENLAVHMEHPDLTAPVRACGMAGLRSGEEANIACLRQLGFDQPCAQAWYYNTRHTRAVCLAPCLASMNQPYHLANGQLNECLQCDEDNSGDVFKAVAGRTRRNSGLASAMCRPFNEVLPLAHPYASAAIDR
jgi:hypothetical protein